MIKKTASLRLLTIVTALCALPATHAAAAYPDKPVTIVVAFAPGGNVDSTARALAPSLAKTLGQPVVIDNRAGAGGTIGSNMVARAQPDGYTLMVGSTATNATAPAFMKATYDPVASFTAIGGISTTPSVVVISPAMNVSTYKELVATSKSRASGLNMGSPGTGSLNHLTTELLKQKTGLNAIHIPYKGAGPALTDLMGNQLDAMVDQLSSSVPFLDSGKLRAVAQTGATRSPLLPNVPTLREQGVQDVDVEVYTGLFAPAGLPNEARDVLVRALKVALEDKDFLARLKAQGSEPLQMSQPEFASYVADEAKRWRDVIETSGVAAQN